MNIFRTAVGGKLPSGDDLKTAVLDGAQWSKYWGIPVKSLVNAPGIANGNSLIPNDRMYSALGSKSYRDVFLVTEKYLNIAKGGLFNFQADDNGLLKGEIVPPIGVDPFQIALAESIKTGKGELEFLWPLRRVRNTTSGDLFESLISFLCRPLVYGHTLLTKLYFRESTLCVRISILSRCIFPATSLDMGTYPES